MGCWPWRVECSGVEDGLRRAVECRREELNDYTYDC